ncbi:hypothetical protein ACRYJU_04455 [Alloalcanivorax xenomutans]|uniref:DUF4259 domain-containing protein n=1 Tax=Alcanivorax xiamenensis TaxID=1177156 RepID=A0ABQ6Y3N9_9GAMM|nr:hypothetical protein [Alcanivorax xiamenensis]KAF0803513.1 hypothetical protein A6D6_03685 [Alcanivorax xiamenensis]
MGAWGVGPFDCDEGLDIKDRWEDWINGYNAVGYDEAIKRFFSRWGDAIRYGDSITNNEIIALVALHFDNQMQPPRKLVKAAGEAINRELELSEVGKWEHDKRRLREEFLCDFLDRLGAVRKKPKSQNLFMDPALNYRSLNVAKKGLLRSFRKIKDREKRVGFDRAGFPTFFNTLFRFMNYGVWEKDSKVFMQANTERLMMLATYLAIGLDYSEDELKALLDEVERKKYRS